MSRLYMVTFWPSGEDYSVDINVRAQNEDEALRLARAATGLQSEASIAEDLS